MMGFGVRKSKGTCWVSQDKAVPKGPLKYLQGPGIKDTLRWLVTRWVPPYKAHIRVMGLYEVYIYGTTLDGTCPRISKCTAFSDPGRQQNPQYGTLHYYW